MMHQSIIDIGR